MHPFSSYTSLRVVHEHMVQEAMEQARVDAQLNSGKSPRGGIRHLLRLLARSLLMKQQQQPVVEPLISKQNSYSHNQPARYPGCDPGSVC